MKTSGIFLVSVASVSLSMQAAWAAGETCAVSPAGMTHWWPGDNAANDLIGDAHGSPQNGATFASGRIGSAFTFNGVGQHVTFGPAAGNFGTSDFTIDFWLRPQNVDRLEALLGKRPVCGHASFFDVRFLRSVTGIQYVSAELDSGTPGNTGYNSVAAPGQFAPGEWYHVALVRSGKTATTYINAGDSAAGGTVTIGVSGWVSDIVNAAPLMMGRSVCIGRDGTNYFTGQIDEVHVFHRALSPEEVAALYDGGSTAGTCKAAVEIDVKPGDAPNSINLRSKGVVSVAILGTEIFSADDVDFLSPMRFAGASVRRVGKGSQPRCHTEDVNDDSRLDLVCHFETAELNLTRDSEEATLTGFLMDGSTFYGTDSVSIVQ